MRKYLGIDAGKSGALVLIDDKRQVIKRWLMPLKVIREADKKNKISKVTIVCFETLCNLLREAISVGCIVVLEEPAPFGMDHAHVAFVKGLNAGIMEAAFTHVGILPIRLTPIQWQKDILEGFDKNFKIKVRARMAAEKYFPNEDFRATHRSKVPHEGLIDASLVALYGQRNYKDLTTV
jgi:hypothetical protein